MKFNCIEVGLQWLFTRYGRFLGKHPWPFLIIPVVITAILASGLLVYFTKVVDGERLYGPINSQSIRNRVIIEELYSGVDGHDMLARHRTRNSGWGQLIITSTDNTANVLRESILQEVLNLHNTVMNVSIQDNGTELSFTNLCMMWNSKCVENELLVLINYDPERIESTELTYPVVEQLDGELVFLGDQLGGVTLRENVKVEQAEALHLTYNLRYDTAEDKHRGLAWEREFLRRIEDFKTGILTIHRDSSHSFDEELDTSSAITLDLVAIVGVVLVTFCILSTHVLDWVVTKPILTSLGVFAAGLALASAFGLLSYLGVPYANVAGSMPFLVLGIGVDDMFIMISAWRRTSIHKTIEDRMSETFEESAFSITITSITDILAFSIGYISQFYSIQLVCLYAAVSVLFAYIYVITFFAACMVIAGRREESNRHALTFRKVLRKDEAPSESYRLFCSGGSLSTTQESHERLSSHADPILTVFFQKYFGPFLTHPVSATLTVIFYLAYISVAIWGFTGLQEGLDLKNAATDDSYLNAYLQMDQLYFRVYGPDMSIVAIEEIRYWDPVAQESIENTLTELESSEYFYDSTFTISWLREYLVFLRRIGITKPSKDVFLSTLRDQFLNIPVYKQFVPDIIFHEDNDSIISSRFYVIGKELNTTARIRNMFFKIRQVVRESDFNLKTYHVLAPLNLEQHIAIRRNTIQILSIGVAVMFITALVFIPSPVCSITVTVSVISTVFGLMGYMSLWNVALDSISMISLIPSLGFSVDFSAHISYAYISAPKKSRRKRSIYALYTLGTPILQGALSTILALVLLITIDSYIFRTFFKTMLLVITIGTLHGLVFLPVFLMLFVGSSEIDLNCHQEVKRNNVAGGDNVVGNANPAFESHADDFTLNTMKGSNHEHHRNTVINVVHNPLHKINSYPVYSVSDNHRVTIPHFNPVYMPD